MLFLLSSVAKAGTEESLNLSEFCAVCGIDNAFLPT